MFNIMFNIMKKTTLSTLAAVAMIGAVSAPAMAQSSFNQRTQVVRQDNNNDQLVGGAIGAVLGGVIGSAQAAVTVQKAQLLAQCSAVLQAQLLLIMETIDASTTEALALDVALIQVSEAVILTDITIMVTLEAADFPQDGLEIAGLSEADVHSEEAHLSEEVIRLT